MLGCWASIVMARRSTRVSKVMSGKIAGLTVCAEELASSV